MSIKLAAIFTDSMVLQRGKEISVWGTCNNDNEIEIKMNDISITADINNGKWVGRLPEMEAGGPYELVVAGNINEPIIIKDIMIGDVWLAGGQSNMEWKLIDSLNGDKEIASIENSKIRFYNTPRIPFIEKEDLETERILEEETEKWNICNKDTAGNLSAVAYYFAKRISNELDITIGIIDCTWGGTSVTCWMSREYLEDEKPAYSYLEHYDNIVNNQTDQQYMEAMAEYDKEYPAWVERVDALVAKEPDISWVRINEEAGRCPWPPPMGRKSPFRPAGLYATMLSRVRPYTIKGFIYYQGEEDTYKASLYGGLMKMLIKQWRDDWNEKLPFIFVQLPMYIGNGDEDDKFWAVIRDEQKEVYKTVDNTGLAIGIDSGEFDNIHPIEKEKIGTRLALQAFKVAYGIDKYPEPPEYSHYEIEEDKLRLYFNNIGDNIKVVSDDNKINAFEIAGDDLKFALAEAVIDKATILLSNEEIQAPKHVRYAWTNYGETPIYSQHDLPLVPFTTCNNLYVNTKR